MNQKTKLHSTESSLTSSLNPFFNSQSTLNLSAKPVGSICKICPEFEHFSPLALLPLRSKLSSHYLPLDCDASLTHVKTERRKNWGRKASDCSTALKYLGQLNGALCNDYSCAKIILCWPEMARLCTTTMLSHRLRAA